MFVCVSKTEGETVVPFFCFVCLVFCLFVFLVFVLEGGL